MEKTGEMAPHISGFGLDVSGRRGEAFGQVLEQGWYQMSFPLGFQAGEDAAGTAGKGLCCPLSPRAQHPHSLPQLSRESRNVLT